jgi:hypothetical protein
MGTGLNVGAFAGGMAEGISRGIKDENEKEQTQALRDDRLEKVKIRGARDELSKALEEINHKSANGMLPGSDDNVIQQPEQAPVASAQQAPAQQTAIATPDQAAPAAAPAAPAQPKQDSNRVKDIFQSNGEGLYKNQNLANDAKYSAIRSAYEKFFVSTGQPERVLDLDKKINEMRDNAYDPLRKATAAAVMSGQPGAIDMVNKFSQAAGLGFQYEGGEYDQKSHTWNNVKVTDAKGKSQVENIPVATMYTVLGVLTPEKKLELDFNREDTARRFSIEDKNAESNRISANAASTKAGAEKNYADARVKALNEDSKGTEVKARVEALNKFFPSADRVLKSDETINDSKEEVARKKRDIEIDSTGRTVAGNLASLNPKVDVRVIAGAARSAASGNRPEKQVEQETGRTYFTHGGVKLYTN